MKSTIIPTNYCYYLIVLQCTLIASFALLATLAAGQPADNTDARNFQLKEESDFGYRDEWTKPDDRGKDATIRNKRTIGFLRQLFPGLSQIIDKKIQQITKVVFRVVGRLILRGGTAGGGTASAGGGGSDSTGSDKGRKISITLPEYPPFEEEDEEQDGATSNQTSTTGANSSTTSATIITSNTANGEINISTTQSVDGLLSSDSTTTVPITTTTGIINPTLPDIGANQISDIAKRRVNRDVSDVLADSTSSVPTPVEEDLSTSEPDKKPANGFLSRLREMRSKRNPFRFGGNGNNAGGSGNFLFDVVRLIAGSGTTPEKDEELNGPREEREQQTDNSGTNINGGTNDNTISASSDDTYGAGIPGPLTRLFVFVNRGISNMIQDLILRLAQTSERVINFKARLITSII